MQCHSIDPAGCKRRLPGGTRVVAGAIPNTSGARGSCCVTSWQIPQLGTAQVADGITGCALCHTARPRGKDVMGGGGTGTDPHTRDFLF